MRRARVSQKGRSAVSVRMPLTRWPPGVVSRRVAKPWSSRRTRIEISDGSPAVVSASQMTVAPPAAERWSSSATLAAPAFPDGVPHPGSVGEGSLPAPGLGAVEDRDELRAVVGAGAGEQGG